MRTLLTAAILAAVLLQACAGNGHDGEPSPAATGSAQMSSSEIVAFVQQYQVAQHVERPDGLWEITIVALGSRVDDFCLDSPRWSAGERTTSWRVFAECTKEESVPADNPLRFEWLFYPDIGSVMPFNHAAHVAQYQYPW
jgi:hypothetical protein